MKGSIALGAVILGLVIVAAATYGIGWVYSCVHETDTRGAVARMLYPNPRTCEF